MTLKPGDTVYVKKFGNTYRGTVLETARTRALVRWQMKNLRERQDWLRVVDTKAKFVQAGYKCCLSSALYNESLTHG